MPAFRRALLALVLMLVAAPTALVLPRADAAGTTTVTLSVSIAGDSSTPVDGWLWSWLDPFSQGGGTVLTGGSVSRELPNGNYIFSVSLNSMDGAARFYRQGVPAGTTVRAEATVVTLDGTPVDLGIEFPQLARLSGAVTNGNGDPMPGVTVLRNRLGSLTQRVTDSLGHYDFGYVQTGRTFVEAIGSGGWAGVMQPVVIPDSGPVTADLVMGAPATLVGVVTDADTGDPVPEIEVSANLQVGTDYYSRGSQLTDTSGHFTVAGLPSGTYVLGFSDPMQGYPHVFGGGSPILSTATQVAVAAGATGSFDQQIHQLPKDISNRALAGVVSDGTAPIPGIEVLALDPDGAVAGADTSDRSGRWAIDAPDGTYRLVTRAGYWRQSHPDGQPWFPEYYPDAWLASAAASIQVAGDLHPGLDFTLARAGVLTSTVTGPGGTSNLNAGYRVYAGDGTLVAERAAHDSSGNQLAALLPAGTWKVLVTGETTGGAQPLLPQWYGGGATLAAAPVVDVDPASTIAGAPTTLPGALRATTRPRVTGRPKVGRTLTATRGIWNLMTGTRFSFTWMRGGRTVGTRAAHRVVKADAGQRLTVKVKATNGPLTRTVTLRVRIP